MADPYVMSALPPFHIAFPVHDIAAARAFWGELMGCSEGRSAAHWVDFDFYGHQIVAHLSPGKNHGAGDVGANPVDGKSVPVPHFGVVLEMDQWQALADRLKAAHVKFVIEPYIRFAGLPGEQATMFLCDPSGNAVEIKGLTNRSQLFAT